MDFHRMDEPPEGQMDRELELLQMLQDGTALHWCRPAMSRCEITLMCLR
jgi:hypothetical protein